MENPTDTTTDTASGTTDSRPLGYWLRAVDRLLTLEFASAFEAEGVTRRDWRLLNLLGGDVVAPELSERLHRHGGKKLRGLIERGWIVQKDGSWHLTDEGRAAHARLGETVAGIRARASSAVSDEDFAVTLASLEAIARELGWNPDERMPRGLGRRGFGPGHHGHGRAAFGREFRGHGFDPRHGYGRARFDGTCGHRDRAQGGHGHDDAQRAYERGFDAGFTRGASSRGA